MIDNLLKRGRFTASERKALEKIAKSPQEPLNKDLEDAEEVLLELELLAPFSVAMAVFQCFYDWRKKHNPHYLDRAQLLCYEAGVVPGPKTQKAFVEAASARYYLDVDRYKEAPGTNKSVQKEDALNSTLMFMANLRHIGLTRNEASRAGAVFHSRLPVVVKNGLSPRKASSLDKEYTRRFEQANESGRSMEEFLFASWDSYQTSERTEAFIEIVNSLPDIDPTMIGTRR